MLSIELDGDAAGGKILGVEQPHRPASGGRAGYDQRTPLTYAAAY
jgi:hypothetical protein